MRLLNYILEPKWTVIVDDIWHPYHSRFKNQFGELGLYETLSITIDTHSILRVSNRELPNIFENFILRMFGIIPVIKHLVHVENNFEFRYIKVNINWKLQ